MDQVFGYIERITFHNPENGFTVARLKQPRKKELTTVVGSLPSLQPGENVRLLGEWKQNPQHGMQFHVSKWSVETPSDVIGIQKYLESGMVRGIGPAYAKRIVKHFKDKTLAIIEETPELLLEIEGIGDKRLETIKSCWQEHKAIRSVMIFLQKYGISPYFAAKLYKVYGNETIERVQENPFALAQNVQGIGFKTADKIAEQMGFTKDATQRIDCGIEYVLGELSSEGHTCYPREEFLEKAKEMLQTEVEHRLAHMLSEGRIIEEGEFIWSKVHRLSEMGIAKEFQRLLTSPQKLREVKIEKALDWVEKTLSLSLAAKQKEAVANSLTHKLQIITGGPGTGKSTITKAILAICEKLTSQIILAAPTGRAAKRMSEITKKEAFTIHALLQFDFQNGGFKRNRENPLHCDLIIIDEASMIDTFLMYHLLKAIPSHARLLLIGDINQLPSVGPGNVLKDMIESQKIPTTQLTEIFRQAKGSRIITNAHLINEGKFPDLSISKGSDFFFIRREEPKEIVCQIVELITQRLSKRYRFDPISDIQVLCPMKKGEIGTENLNRVLQESLNPQKEYWTQGGMRFAKQDKVMQIRNNYNKEVYNGDIGQVLQIDREEQMLRVRFDKKEVDYLFSELDDLVLAYATSVHKYQGSEAPCVIIPIHTTHFMMLHRNLLYTAVTRGKRLVILVGIGKAIGIAVATDDVNRRHTGLNQALMKSLPPQEAPAESPIPALCQD